MERRFFAFCALAIVPCGIASGAAARAANDGWDELAHESAAVRRAMAGDTVSALDPTASGVELMVLFPDDEGQLRCANGWC